MLQGKFRESVTLHSTGHVEVPLPDDDPTALTIILNISHLRVRKVPRTVKQSTLAQIACLVDKYCFHEAVETFSDGWVNHLKDKAEVDSTSSADIAELLAVYYCFHRETEFGEVSKKAILNLKDDLAVRKFPIPSSYVGMLPPPR